MSLLGILGITQQVLCLILILPLFVWQNMVKVGKTNITVDLVFLYRLSNLALHGGKVVILVPI